LIRLAGKYKNVEELRNLVVSSKNGIQVRLRDIADVQDGQKTAEKIARVDQKSHHFTNRKTIGCQCGCG
jgi:HAE1 family hydrophobic/amphiphilic exporter-1